MKIRSAIASAMAGLTLIGGAALAAAVPAEAATATTIDVGYTVREGGYWKGSGSYSNGSGQYARACVEIWVDRLALPDSKLSGACRTTSVGSAQSWSAPSVPIKFWPGDEIFTRVQAFDAYNNVVATKISNRIPAT
ncbi:hypothetical protein ACQPYK_01985 [Streptosporangium sp. CA-135522]|uniref:hypothetical protein n=1 Tax=Streptosporangium sp. CA-135522 TaxID=3240072 RepID=UPI003D8D5CDE